MLKTVVIEDYRSCISTKLNLCSTLSVLIGPNGSGKTNILQALMLLKKITQGYRHFFVGEEERKPSPNCNIKAEFHLKEGRAELSCELETKTDDSNSDSVTGSIQNWSITPEDGRNETTDLPLHYFPLAQRQREAYRIVRKSATRKMIKPIEEGLSANTIKVLGEASEFCSGIDYYGASQFTNPGSCPVSFEIEDDENTGGFVPRSLRNYAHENLLRKMYSASKAENQSDYAQFSELVGRNGLRLVDGLRFRDIQTSSTLRSVKVGGKIEAKRIRKVLVVPQFKIGQQSLSPNQLSEGTFKTLALLFNLITSESRLLLIEEPEVCVHQGLLLSITELIKSYSSRKQIILSTHSDHLLDHVSPENVFVVSRSNKFGTMVHRIPEAMNAQGLSALHQYLEREGNLGDYWRAGGLEELP